MYGHIHDYERYLPVYNYTVGGGVERSANGDAVYVAPGATVHVTAGGAGNSEMRRGECPPPRGACRWADGQAAHQAVGWVWANRSGWNSSAVRVTI